MKRSHSDNNLEDESNHSGDGNNLSTGSGSQTGGSYNNNRGGLKRNRNEENIRLLIPSRVSDAHQNFGQKFLIRLKEIKLEGDLFIFTVFFLSSFHV